MIELFITLLLPNLLRQFTYWKAQRKTKSFGFCVSPETRFMQRKKLLPWIGLLEEVLWGLVWVAFWYAGWQWLAFGWVSDALIDCFVAFAWSKGVKEPKRLFYKGKQSFFIREILLPYLIIGPLAFLLGIDIITYSIACMFACFIALVLV